jgi:hypothetical protein
MVTSVSDGFTPNRSRKASAVGSSSSSTQTWGSRLRAANSLRRVASLEWREPIILRPRPVLIPHERLARKYYRGDTTISSRTHSAVIAARFPTALSSATALALS